MKTVKEKIEIFKKANIETLLELENLLPELGLYELAYCVRLAYKEKNTLNKVSSIDISEESEKLGVDINQVINNNFDDLI